MPSAPLPSDEKARLEELRRYVILDTPPEPAFEQLTELAATICQTPVSLISLVDENRQWFKSKYGLTVPETPRTQAFCGYTILSDRPFVVADALSDERFQDNPLVICEQGMRFYAGIPLVTAGGYRMGSICVIDYVPRTLTDWQLKSLNCLGNQVVMLMENRRYADRLLDYAIALEQAHDHAFKASQAKSVFLANMNHELRTPLNAIMGFAQLLSGSPTLPDKERNYSEIILHSGQHLLDLVEAVLETSRLEAHQAVYQETEVDLPLLINEVTELFQLQALQKKLTLKVEGQAQIPKQLSTDARKLKQILINLVGNAVKFTETGSVTLRFSVATEAGSPSFWLFEVEDTGPGIASADIAGIFEAFGQASAGRQIQQGTGLGLSISQGFARLMGGEITVTSALGRGSCFTLTIQAKVPAANH